MQDRNLMGVSDFFFRLGRGKGESEARGQGGIGFIENPRRAPGGRRGREDVCGELGNFGGGGLNIFFRGRNVHQGNLLKLRSLDPSCPFLLSDTSISQMP